jgi:mono/diheme cytochrome c family protein
MNTKIMMVTVAALVGCRSEAANAPTHKTVDTATKQPMSLEESVKRGKHLTLVSGCNDCHTPLKLGPNGPEPDWSRELSGHPAELVMPPAPKLPEGPWLVTVAATNTAWAGPWGVSFTANLTPDKDTGTGTWTKQNFIDTIKNGRHLGAGRPLLPPMPAAMYAHYSAEDLGAIYDYLRTLKPISNMVPAPLAPAQGGK